MPRIARIVCAWLLLTTSSAWAQRKVDEHRAIVPNGFVRIFMLSGSVTVIGWDQDSLVVTGTVWEPPGDHFAVGITPKGAKLGLWSDLESNMKPSDIVVRVPRRSQVWIKTTDADIHVSAVSGGLDLFSVSGSIDIAGTPAEVYAETMGGQIALNTTTQSARVKTAAGGIRVSGSITDLTAVTVSGPVDVAKTSFARARLESVDGDIRYSGTLSKGSALDVTNHAGAIELLLPIDVNADFSVSMYTGQMTNDFGVKMKAKEGRFSLGKAPSARVTLRSFKGRVALRKLSTKVAAY